MREDSNGKTIEVGANNWSAARTNKEWQALVDKLCPISSALPTLEPSNPGTDEGGDKGRQRVAERPRNSSARTGTTAKPSPNATADPMPRGQGSSGSGFFVSKSGHILTNNHVAGACSSLTISYDGLPLDARLVATDAALDLALIKVSARPTMVANFRAGRSLSQGETIVAAGYPLKGLLASGPIISSGIINALAGIQNDAKFLQISAPLQAGNSGGPILDSYGNVVGVVVSKLDMIKVAKLTGDIVQNVNFAIKGDVARTFVEANQVDPQLGRLEQHLDSVQVSSIARGITVPIECRQ